MHLVKVRTLHHCYRGRTLYAAASYSHGLTWLYFKSAHDDVTTCPLCGHVITDDERMIDV